MKKAFLLLIAVLLLVITCMGSTVFADGASVVEPLADDALLSTEDFVRQLCQLNSAASGNAQLLGDVRQFLTRQFDLALGGEYTEQVYCSDSEAAGYNLVATVKSSSGSDKCVVVGAHYDSVGEGANDNAVGVAALREVMQRVANGGALPFDVTFVAFDCEEDGLVGSTDYVESRVADNPERVLAMFNVDSIALGNNLYVMCENKHTDLADLVLSQSEKLIEKPYAKGVNNMADLFGYGYYEFVQGTDHTPFRLQGIPTVSFFAGDYTFLGYTQDAALNTSNDTFANLGSSGADYLERISIVSQAIYGSLADGNFLSVAQKTRKQLVNNDAVFNRWWPALTVLGVLMILGVFAWLYYRKLQKKAILGTADVKTGNVFDKPRAEDIFSFDDSKTSGSGKSDSDGDDVDGIFTFKK